MSKTLAERWRRRFDSHVPCRIHAAEGLRELRVCWQRQALQKYLWFHSVAAE